MSTSLRESKMAAKETSLKRLICWSGDWGLPSADVGCLQVMAYAKFAGCPLKVEKNNNPLKSPSWQLPVLKSEEKLIASPNNIMDYLREKNFNADYYLTAKQGADTLAFSALVQDKLYPAILYTMWVDSKNYTELTRPWYAGVLPLPLNWIVPGRIASNVHHSLTVDLPECDYDTLESKITKNFLECLTLLSEYLGNKEFFFKESPTTLDAVVFAHLAIILKVPLPNNKLQNHLHGYDNLVMFTNRILQRYFPPDPQDGAKKQSSSTTTPTDDFLDENETRNKLLWAGFVFVSMVTYACFTGMIGFPLKGKNINEDESENFPDMTAFHFEDGRDDFDDGGE